MKSITESIVESSNNDIEFGQQTITSSGKPKKYVFMHADAYRGEIYALQYDTAEEAAEYFGTDDSLYRHLMKIKVGDSYQDGTDIYCRIH